MRDHNLTPQKIVQVAAKRRRRATRLILLGLPVAVGGFILAAALDTTIGQERAGLVMLGGMICAFLLFGVAFTIYRCPACNKVPGRWTTTSHYRVWFSSAECEQCGALLR